MSVTEVNGNFENANGSVRVSTKTGGWFFEANDGLTIHVAVTGKKSDWLRMWGFTERQRAFTIGRFVNCDCEHRPNTIADRNCPASEGMHTTVRGGSEFKGTSVTLNLGRLDSRGDGSTEWIERGDQVRWSPG